MTTPSLTQKATGSPLEGRLIFLSGSVPASVWQSGIQTPADPSEAEKAVLAIAEAVLAAGGRLVCGGHPTFSSLVRAAYDSSLRAALGSPRSLRPAVRFYQSELFVRNLCTSPAWPLLLEEAAEVVVTPCVGADRPLLPNVPPLDGQGDESLLLMRRAMIEDNDLSGAVFIGGMKGVHAEFALFANHHASRPVFLVGSPGGAARELAQRRLAAERDARNAADAREFARSRDYAALARRIIERLGGSN